MHGVVHHLALGRTSEEKIGLEKMTAKCMGPFLRKKRCMHAAHM
jgi:hypothetical protein